MKSSEIKINHKYVFTTKEDTNREQRIKGTVLADEGSYFLVQRKHYKTCVNKCDIDCGYTQVREIRR